MKKLFIFLVLCLQLSSLSARTFVHPGALLSTEEIEKMKRVVQQGSGLQYDQWQALLADPRSQSTWRAHGPTSDIGGSDGVRQRASKDGVAARFNATIWQVTGDTSHADAAVQTLMGWCDSIKSARNQLFQYPCRDLIQAAEMLRNSDGTFYSGWAQADVDRFLTMVRDIFVPALRGQKGNLMTSWSAGAIDGVLSAGVLLDDEDIYNEGLGYFTDTDIPGSIASCTLPTGQSKEMGRDNVHANLTLDDLARMAQIAWHQGDDLFSVLDNRLMKMFDYWCQFNSGHDDTYYEPWKTTTDEGEQGGTWFYIQTESNGFRLRPDGTNYECVYHHYKEVKKIDNSQYPYLTMFTTLARPEVDYGTLFYIDDMANAPVFTTVPAQPTGVKAIDGLGHIDIRWTHPATEDQRDYKIYRSEDGSNFTLLNSTEYSTANFYHDNDVETGKRYYYRVAFANLAGVGPQSPTVSATAQAGSDSLPGEWKVANIGTAGGTAVYSDAMNGSLQISGTGAGAGSTADSYTYVYRPMKGDGSLVVKIENHNSDFNRIGIVIRQSLTANIRMVGLTLGHTGHRYCYAVARTTNGGSTSWTIGDDFTSCPAWFKITRRGNDFYTYQSRDGKVWHLVTKTTCILAQNSFAGIFVCDGNTSGNGSTVLFDNVTFTDEDNQPCAAPEGLEAKAIGSRKVQLSWQKDDSADAYQVERSEDNGGTFAVLADKVTETTYTDNGLQAEHTYVYRVRGINQSGVSADSSVVSVTTLAAAVPACPSHLAARWAGRGRVALNWTADDEASSYVVMREGAESTTFTVGETTDTMFIDSTLADTEASYTYLVYSRSEAGQSAEAAKAEAKFYPAVAVTGTITGTDGSYNDKSNSTKNAVFDNDFATYFDAPASSGSWVGYDMGRQYKAEIVGVSFCPRKEVPERMVGGRFEVSTSSDFSDAKVVYIVSDVPALGRLTTVWFSSVGAFRYVRYIGPDDASCNVAEIKFLGRKMKVATQKITFPQMSEKHVGDADFNPGATASSGLQVIYKSSNEDVATIVGDMVHIVAAGSTTITASQPGDDRYAAALNVHMLLQVSDASLGIATVGESKTVSHVDYFDLSGRAVSSHHAGVTIKRTVFADGTTETVKVVM